jgi:penicillin-binding protein 2
LKDHSWFVCFAPRENPTIAVAVIVENAGFGATWAGPMAALVMEKYLRDTLSAVRWKEVERIEGTEIILPIVKTKRNRLDSLRKQKMRKLLLRTTAKHSMPDNPSKKTVVVYYHLSALKPDNEEQFI